MLHPIPDSTFRKRLLCIVDLQVQLVRALCTLPANSRVDQQWLVAVWKGLDTDWIRRFWENDKGNRAIWINRVASASVAEKQEMLEIGKEQLRFRELWATMPSVRMRQVRWNRDPYQALNSLLKSFYAPLFYRSEGYLLEGAAFHKDDFIAGMPSAHRKVCPYCDNYLQKTELDHFLPKDEFPFLSCHPDNLIPSCHDSNSGSHKGTIVPLDWNRNDQAVEWFHPRWRSGSGRVKVEVGETPERTLTVRLAAVAPSGVARVANLDETFRISEFWLKQSEDELQLIGSQVSDQLHEEKAIPSEEFVRGQLKALANSEKAAIGKRGLAICHHALYLYAANNPAIVSDITRQCLERAAYESQP